MKHRISHDLGTELAARATKAAFASYQQKFTKYNPQAVWTSDTHADISFRVKMVTLRGRLEISESSIVMELDVPMMFRVFKDKAVRAIDKEVRQWIAKAKAGELD